MTLPGTLSQVLTTFVERVWRWEDPSRAAQEIAVVREELRRLETALAALDKEHDRRALSEAVAALRDAIELYGRALVRFPIDRYRSELQAHEVLLEGVVLSMAAWEEEFKASTGRLATFRAEWRLLTEVAERASERAFNAVYSSID